ncbi:Coiled-coil domain-containing protein 174 [Chionoecetes opilio]|uniref:Coiled-coil domain-containing protein 174 n=1 Tax=Chionoecetes opilio TaxID=41210 RepID=A0A8J5D011_CHIOP|nr:Coiled-coil domain-containing protein 174 [Chionoecetes opilio]
MNGCFGKNGRELLCRYRRSPPHATLTQPLWRHAAAVPLLTHPCHGLRQLGKPAYEKCLELTENASCRKLAYGGLLTKIRRLMCGFLVGLRAELQKKRAEASKHGPDPRGRAGREREAVQPKVITASNAGVSGRAARDEEQHQAEKRTEEKTRQSLERKAAMYDKLHQGVDVLEDDNLNHKFLVNFQKKIVDDVLERKKTREEKEKARKQKQKAREEADPDAYSAEGDEEKWVEFVDAFGRTRECLRSELSQRLEQEKQLSQDLNFSNTTCVGERRTKGFTDSISWVTPNSSSSSWDICIVVRQTVNCFEASFVRPSEDDDAAVNAGPRDRRMLHEGNSSPME